MSGRIMLIAGDAPLDALRAHGDLPPKWLVDAGPENAALRAESPAPLVLRCRHDLLLAQEGCPQQPSLDAASRTELIHNFLDATIVYLAVVGGAADAPQDRGQAGTPPASLPEHVAWYERFRNEVTAQVQAREVHLRHVLVLVCREEISGDHWEHFRRLVAGRSDDRLFDVAYVMLHELEPGRKPDAEGALLLNAEHVWPMAVGDLLLKLLHDAELPRKGPTASYAWRSYELLPEIPATEQQEVFAEQFERFYSGLTEAGSSGPGWDAGPFTSFKPRTEKVKKVPLRAPGTERDPLGQTWLEYAPLERLDETRAADRWEKGLNEAGDAVARELSRRALAEEPAARREAANVWKSAHRKPGAIYAALADHRTMTGPALSDQFGTMNKCWESIRATERHGEALLRDAEACSAHLMDAQRGHVNWLYRLVVFAAVTLAVGYLSMAVFQPLVGAGHAFWIALGGALGALVAAMFSFDRERAAGRRAQEAFEEKLRRIDRTVIDRHEACQAAVEQADVFCQQTRAAAAGRRLHELLRRVQSMLDHELRPQTGRPGHTSEDEGRFSRVEDPANKEPAAAGRQRLRYAQVTRLEQPVDYDDLKAVGHDEELEHFVAEQVNAFRDDVWLNFCRRYDRVRAGHLPAAELIPVLRRFRDGFQKALTAKIRQLAIRRFAVKDLNDWGMRLRKLLELQPYFELMSCRMTSSQTADELSRPRLYLREGFEHRPLMLALSGSRIQNEPEISPLLVGMPLVGFLFQEMPVQFEVGADDKIVVAAYRDKTSGEPTPAGEPVVARRGPSAAVEENDSPATPTAGASPARRRRRPK